MLSNKTVTYVDIGLNSLEEYWAELVFPSAKEFREAPTTRTAFGVATNLWHFHVWAWHDLNPGVNSGGAAFQAYRDRVVAACPELVVSP